jgi:hypothetical protein
MKITPEYLENIISEARESGASLGEIRELEDYLEQIKSNGLKDEKNAVFTYKTVDEDGKTVIRASTAPIHPDDQDDFADLTPKSVKKGLYKSK